MIRFLLTWFDDHGRIIASKEVLASGLGAAMRRAAHHIDDQPGAVSVHVDQFKFAAHPLRLVGGEP